MPSNASHSAGAEPGPGKAQRRVKITSPRMAAAPRPPARSTTSEIDELTGVGEVYIRSLVRAQLRQGLSTMAVVGIALGTLPLVFAVLPRLSDVRLVTVPLPWLVLGVGVYPVLWATALWHVRRAERAERQFDDLLGSD